MKSFISEVTILEPEQILEGVRNRENHILTYLYEKVFPPVRKVILQKGGSEEDAKDIFQEAIIIVFQVAARKNFTIEQAFEGYLYGICNKIWLKMQRSRSIHERSIRQVEPFESCVRMDDEKIDNELRMRLYRKYFLLLPKECQRMLRMLFSNIPYEDIALEMGYKSEKIVRNKKYKCKETLTRSLKTDPHYPALTEQI